MAASPPVCAVTAPAADSLKSLRRVMRAIFPPVVVVRGPRACSVAQIARSEALFANQENHGRSVQPRTPGRMAGREYAVSDQIAAAIWSRGGCQVRGRQAALPP